MAIQSSGTISLSNIRDEYNNGSSAPILLNDYYRGGTLVRDNASNNTSTNLSANVPTSANNSPLSINDFYGQIRGFKKTFSSTATDQSGVGIFGDDFAIDYPKEIVIDSSQTVGSTDPSNAALTIDSTGVGSITITNNGSIEGAGGNTNGGTGGNALQVDGSVAVTLVNNGTIKAGGGGGGQGGTGGVGSGPTTAVISNVTDKTGTAPSFVTYEIDTAFGPRTWGGVGSSQWGLKISSNPVRSNISERGPVWFSFQVDTSAEYTLTGRISNPYPEDGQYGHRGQPRIDISTAENTASQGQGGGLYGNSVDWSGIKASLAANTLYYFCNYTVGPYTYTAGSDSTGTASKFFYNDMTCTLSLTIDVPTNGGSGGTGGVGQGYNQAADSGSGGGTGGTNAGTGGTGGTGGAFGASGTSGSTGNNGSGTSISYPSSAPGNGASGSSGGASGKSIQGVSNVTSSGSGSLTGGTA